MVIPNGFTLTTVAILVEAMRLSGRALFQRFYYLITPLGADGKGTVFRRVFGAQVTPDGLFLMVGADLESFPVTYETALYWVDPIDQAG